MITPFSDESGSEAEAAIARRIAFQLKRLDLVCPWQGLEKGEALGEAHGPWPNSTAGFSELNRFDVKVRGFEHEEDYYDVIAILSGCSEFSVSGTDQRPASHYTHSGIWASG